MLPQTTLHHKKLATAIGILKRPHSAVSAVNIMVGVATLAIVSNEKMALPVANGMVYHLAAKVLRFCI